MPNFAFTARDTAGRTQRGVLSAGSAAELATQLRQRGWLVLDVQTTKESTSGLAEALDPRGWLPVRSIDVEMALQQIAVMLRSGLTLLNSLATAAEHADRFKLRRILRTVITRIQEGSSFADALAEHACFSNLTVQLVRVGEQTGNLDVVIVRSAEAMERRRMLKQQVITAMTYPAIVLMAAIGVTTFMLVSVIPKLEVFVKALGRKLPPSTEFLIAVSAWLKTNGLMATGGLVLAGVVGFLVYSSPAGRYAIDRSLLRLPLFGKVFRVAGTALFARAMGILIGSGVTVLDALRTMETLGQNKYLSRIVVQARARVFAGGSLAETFNDKSGFMPMLGRMVAVGESAGTLDDVLNEVAKFFENQLAILIKQLSALLEPAIIIFVGGVVGFVYISFFLALYAGAGSRK